MQLDRLALHLRRRRPWEAIDLGCLMAQHWWRPIMQAWLAAYLPVAVVLYIVFRSHAWVAMALLWWLKPLFDRIALEVLARAVFGDVPSVAQALRALRNAPGVLASLTLHRFDLARSYGMPVWHLERLRGKAARDRSRSLQRRDRGTGVWTTIVFFNFELALTLALFGLIDFFTPVEYDAAFGLKTLFWGEEAPLWRQLLAATLQVVTVSVLEPFYVASGFALYLNRRTQLEAWDLELTLRGLARIEPAKARAATVAAALIAGLFVMSAVPRDAAAESTSAQSTSDIAAASTAPQSNINNAAVSRDPQSTINVAAASPDPQSTINVPAASPDPQSTIKEILAAKEFERYRETTRYRWRGSNDAPSASDEPSRIGAPLAEIARALMWIGVAALAGLLLYYARRYIGAWMPEVASRRSPPAVLFGMDIAPESLPADIVGAARAAIDAGRAREALGLMYRGALSVLVTRDGLEVEAGDTEGDCVRRTRSVVEPEKARVFASLVAAWQSTAYAQRPPETDVLRELWSAWSDQFGVTQR